MRVVRQAGKAACAGKTYARVPGVARMHSCLHGLVYFSSYVVLYA